MKNSASIPLIIAAISLTLGVVSRLTLIPIPIMPGGVGARSFLLVTNTCLLLAVVALLLDLSEKKQ